MKKATFLFLSVILISCGKLSEEERKRYEFDQALAKVKENLRKMEAPVKKALEKVQFDINKIRSGDKLSTGKIKKEWRTTGTKLAKEIADVHVDFQEVQIKLDTLFQLLNRKAETMKGNSLYPQMIKDRKDAKKRYKDKLDEAKRLFMEIEKTKEDIKDFGKVIEYYAILGEIEKGIKEIENIILRVKDLNDKLKSFSA